MSHCTVIKRQDAKGFTWIARYYKDGKRKALRLGTDREVPTRELAQRKAADLVPNMNDDPHEVITFGQLVARYKAEEMPSFQPHTASSYKSMLKHLEAKWSNEPLAKMLKNPIAIETWLSDLQTMPTKTKPSRPCSKKTKQNVKAVLHRLIECAMRLGYQPILLANVYKLIPTLAEEAVSRAKLEREFEIAREVQERLFPQTLPKVRGVEMAAHCRPAQAVGGDYYDLIDILDGSGAETAHAPGENVSSPGRAMARACDRLGIAIGDISGKGLSAALLMASLHASLRGQVLSGTGDLGTKMANVNSLLYNASESNRYATFFYAELACASRMLHYVNGGHNPPAVLRKQDGAWRVFRLADGGPVVGLLAGAVYREQTLQLLPGDILLAFTDGISEAMNASEDEWGEDRMIAEAQAHTHLNAEELLQRLFHAADTFADGAPQHDDMTLLVMQL
ncbi:Stage II sporulation protein E (SpoIIE) [Granulicella pectinivorans]|uniref:Stage II sporulation protein E (SpoIIE) n=2 Tax=Acidobacteriaceae TaxID=204434 RepID=A0A1I6MHU6_9BACT|nr:Stage II sporulation protein E (SpoIIE) [Granulicella pectinivorans]